MEIGGVRKSPGSRTADQQRKQRHGDVGYNRHAGSSRRTGFCSVLHSQHADQPAWQRVHARPIGIQQSDWRGANRFPPNILYGGNVVKFASWHSWPMGDDYRNDFLERAGIFLLT